jgi:hypothetical protein
MTLFALAGLLDRDGAHKALARAIVGARFERLYAAAWASLNPTTRSARAITRRSTSARLKPTGGRL